MGWIALASAIAGIISTLLAYFLNPQRHKDNLRRQLIDTYQQLEVWERKRDEALQKNDSDGLTIATDTILRLRKVKADLLQQLTKG
jgi:hypothetical protein